MSGIEIVNEDTRPIVICPHCKGKVIVNIKPFNENITGIAQYTCNKCRGNFFGGILLIVNTTPERLFDHIKMVVDAAQAANVHRPGEPDRHSKIIN